MTTSTEAVPGIRIEQVRVGERARKDYGDLTTLKVSIIEHGLLQPIVLLPDNSLLCGGRRLEACRQLGWEAIPYVKSATKTDALSRLTAERDENTCRKDMTPSELVALGELIAELKRPEAEQRHRQGSATGGKGGRPGTSVPGLEVPPVDHTTRREIAEALGISEGTYKRAKRVVTASEDESATPEMRQVAQEARAQMDAGTISVSAANKRVREAQEADAVQATAPSSARRGWLPLAERLEQIRGLASTGRTSGQIGEEIGVGEYQVRKLARDNGIEISADRVMDRSRRGIDSRKIVQETVSTLEGVAVTTRLINFAELSDIPGDWVSSLDASINSLTGLKTKLKELTQ